MLAIIKDLETRKKNVAWTYKEVWSGAGLKSNIALSSPWNAHIRDIIKAHNDFIKLSKVNHLSPSSKSISASDVDVNLKLQIGTLKLERDEALSKIAVREAEIDYHKSINKDLQQVNERLKRQIGLTTIK